MLAGMAGTIDTDSLMIVVALLAVVLTFERHDPRTSVGLDFGRDVVRLMMVGLLALAATAEAQHWREWLYAFLMPLGAYYLARAIVDPMARRWGERRMFLDEIARERGVSDAGGVGAARVPPKR